jgi:hypothetical protein
VALESRRTASPTSAATTTGANNDGLDGLLFFLWQPAIDRVALQYLEICVHHYTVNVKQQPTEYAYSFTAAATTLFLGLQTILTGFARTSPCWKVPGFERLGA